MKLVADLLTLSRFAAAAALFAQAGGRGVHRGPWLALLAGCTLTDWLDGPLARRGGASAAGAVLDEEADSALTLAAAISAVRAARVPTASLAAPLVRYPVRLLRRRRLAPNRAWQRAAGVMQMAVLCGALAPWPALQAPARRLAPLATSAQLVALAADLL